MLTGSIMSGCGPDMSPQPQGPTTPVSEQPRLIEPLAEYAELDADDLTVLASKKLSNLAVLLFKYPEGGAEALAAAALVNRDGAWIVKEVEHIPVVPPSIQSPGFTALVDLHGSGWIAFAGSVDQRATSVKLLDATGDIVASGRPASGSVVLIGSDAATVEVFSGDSLISARFAGMPAQDETNVVAAGTAEATAVAGRFISALLSRDFRSARKLVASWVSADSLVGSVTMLMPTDVELRGSSVAPGGRTYRLSDPDGNNYELTLLVGDNSSDSQGIYYYEFRKVDDGSGGR